MLAGSLRLLAADITEKQVACALGEFETMWETLTPNEQAPVLALFIEQHRVGI